MSRPFVFINVAATADGKIDTIQRRGASISSARDKERVDQLRASSDAVMVGSRTLHDEDPRLTVKSDALRLARQARGLPPNPAKVAVASRLQLKPDCRFLSAGPARLVLFTTSQTAQDQLDMLRAHAAQVHVLDGPRPDLTQALQILHEQGIQRLMAEGGATLNAALLALGLVDEVSMYIAPLLFGGETAPTLAGGPALFPGAAIRLKRLSSDQWDDGGIVLRYAVQQLH